VRPAKIDPQPRTTSRFFTMRKLEHKWKHKHEHTCMDCLRPKTKCRRAYSLHVWPVWQVWTTTEQSLSVQVTGVSAVEPSG
jgi:hypothetical protein